MYFSQKNLKTLWSVPLPFSIKLRFTGSHHYSLSRKPARHFRPRFDGMVTQSERGPGSHKKSFGCYGYWRDGRLYVWRCRAKQVLNIILSCHIMSQMGTLYYRKYIIAD